MVRESAKAEKSNNFSIKRVLRKRAFNLPSEWIKDCPSFDAKTEYQRINHISVFY